MPKFRYGFMANPTTAPYRHWAHPESEKAQRVKAISLFSGCGGLDLGFMGGFQHLGRVYPRHPIDIIQAVDNSEDAMEAYRLNLGSHTSLLDLANCNIHELLKADLLLGGFPCQDFSSSGPKVGLLGSRGQLYRVLANYMQAHQPAVVVGENVPHLARLRGGKYLDTILRDFEAEGYRFDVWDLYAPDYGLPQSRRRLFLIGVRADIPGYPIPPEPTHASCYVSIDEAIHDLEGIEDESISNQSQYFVASRASSGGGQGDHTNKRDEVAYCIRANARGRIQFHHNLPRRLTVRECARLQSFPDEFVFPFSTQRNMTLIGNAVPPLLGTTVAGAIYSFMVSRRLGKMADGQVINEEIVGVTNYRARSVQQEMFSGGALHANGKG